MTTVELWGLSDFFGLIIPEKTGVIYLNQAGGVSCSHPSIEGYYIPLPLGWMPKIDSLYNIGYMDYDPEHVQKFIDESEYLKHHFKPVDHDFLKTKQIVDEENLFMEEAWVPVVTKRPTGDAVGRGEIGSREELIPQGKFGILTYENSD